MKYRAADVRRRLRRLEEWKHVALLVVIVAVMAGHPMLIHGSSHTIVFADIVFAIVTLGVILVVFAVGWERWLAISLLFPGMLANVAYFYVAEQLRPAMIVLYHCSAVTFFGFAVAVVLRGVFKRKVIRTDDIIGAACGYLLAAIAWSSLYALVHVLDPGSFRVADEIAWQLGDWHTSRVFFDYFSIVTLTGLGYGDITPTTPPAYALISLEVVFGLFYLAVVVAQLVGLMTVRRDNERGPS